MIMIGSVRAFISGKGIHCALFSSHRSEPLAVRIRAAKFFTPFVLGAVLNMKRCLDFADSSAIPQLWLSHQELIELSEIYGVTLPTNSKSLRRRELDCAVTNLLHITRVRVGLPVYNTMRGLFIEGAPIYEGAGINEFDRTQICVRDVSCILGYFRPIALTN